MRSPPRVRTLPSRASRVRDAVPGARSATRARPERGVRPPALDPGRPPADAPVTMLLSLPHPAPAAGTTPADARPRRRVRTPLFVCFSLASLALVTLEPGEALAGKSGPRVRHPKRQTGLASWYGPGFFDRRTASGERFDPAEMAAAHRTLPFGTRIRVTNLDNGRRVVLRVNDRGPFKKGRVLDVTPIAAKRLGFRHLGVARVRIDVLRLPRPTARVGDALPATAKARA